MKINNGTVGWRIKVKEDHHSYRHDYAVAKKSLKNVRLIIYGIWALEFHAIPLQHSTNWAIWLVSSTVECCTVIVEVKGLIPEYTSLNFFRLSFQNCKVSVYNCNDLSFNSVYSQFENSHYSCTNFYQLSSDIKRNPKSPKSPKSDQHQISPCNINAL